MSSHNKHIQQIEKILRNDLRRMDRDELYFMYGIQISATGAVYDTVNELTYHCIGDWMDV
jgi:predicted transposase YdaD